MPTKPTKGFIDGDLALFPAASVAQTTWYIYKDEDGNEIARFDAAAKGATWLEEFEVFGFDAQFGYTGDHTKLIRSVEIEPEDFETAKKNFISLIKKWAKGAGVDDYEVYVSKASGHPNFRYDVAIRKPYKGNRTNSVKPFYLEDLRKWALTLPYVKKGVGIVEVDDVVCAKAQRMGEKAVLIQADKDGLQCVGCWVFNPNLHNEPVFSDPTTVGFIEYTGKKVIGIGWLFLLGQTIFSDTADNVPGLDGSGFSKAMQTLSPYNNKPISCLPQAISDVCDLYMARYGDEHEIVDKDGTTRIVSWFDLFEESCRLSYMLKHKNDYPHVMVDVARRLYEKG